MRKNKILSVLLSIAIAFGLWLYVVNYVSVESTTTIYNIPIAFEGETILTTDRNLMITSGKDSLVNLTLTGSRSDLNKVDNKNITLKVDLTKVYEPGERELEYNISFPSDVPTDAFVVENRYPGSTVTITVEKKLTKDVPVQVVYNGSAPDGFLSDQENAVLDYTAINVSGPSSAVELIDHATITVDLEGRTESVSENFRYTLCDAEGNPVDAEKVTTNVAEVRLELPIKRFEEVPLVAELVYGGGAASHTTNVTIEPETIRVSGSETMLAEFTQVNLGSIDLSTITEDTELTFPVSLPEGVANLSGIDEAVVKISFIGLSIKEFTVEKIRVTNVPEGLEYELLNQALKVTLRGETALINSIEPEDISVTVSCKNKEIGTSTVKASVKVKGDKYADVGAVGSYSVSVTLREAVPEETT